MLGLFVSYPLLRRPSSVSPPSPPSPPLWQIARHLWVNSFTCCIAISPPPCAPLSTSFPPAVASRAGLAGRSPHYFLLLLFSHPWVPRAPTSFVNFGNVAAVGAPFSSHQLLSSFAFCLLSPQRTPPPKKEEKTEKNPPQMSSPSLAL